MNRSLYALVLGMAVFVVGAIAYNQKYLHFGRNSSHSERSALKAGEAEEAMASLRAGLRDDVAEDGFVGGRDDDHGYVGAARAAEVNDPALTTWRQQGVALAQMAGRSTHPALVDFAQDAGDVDRRALEGQGIETSLTGYVLDDVKDADFDRVYLDAWLEHVRATPSSSPTAGTTTQQEQLAQLESWKAEWFANGGSLPPQEK